MGTCNGRPARTVLGLVIRAADVDGHDVSMQVAIIAGFMYTLVGVLQLGFLSNFLSMAIIGGVLLSKTVLTSLACCCCKALESWFARVLCQLDVCLLVARRLAVEAE